MNRNDQITFLQKTYRHKGHVGDGKDEAKSGKYRIPSNERPVLLWRIDSIACFPKIENKKVAMKIFLILSLEFLSKIASREEPDFQNTFSVALPICTGRSRLWTPSNESNAWLANDETIEWSFGLLSIEVVYQILKPFSRVSDKTRNLRR